MEATWQLPPLGSPACRLLNSRVDATIKIVLMSTTALLAPLSKHSPLMASIGVVVVLLSILQVRSQRIPHPVELAAANVLASGVVIAVLWQTSPAFSAAFGPMLFVIVVVHMGALRSRRETLLQLAWALSLFAIMLLVRVDRTLAIATWVTAASVLILLAVAVTEARRRIDRLVAELQRTADFDPLTGLLNRHGVQSRIPALTSADGRTTAVLIDLDHFKEINDQHGHLAGDEVLMWIGRTLTAAVRAPDLVARYGGEEFLVLVAGGDLDRGSRLAERVRALIENGSRHLPHPVTISAGVAMGSATDDLSGLYARADHALYAAKAAGRNQVRINLDAAATQSAHADS